MFQEVKRQLIKIGYVRTEIHDAVEVFVLAVSLNLGGEIIQRVHSSQMVLKRNKFILPGVTESVESGEVLRLVKEILIFHVDMIRPQYLPFWEVQTQTTLVATKVVIDAMELIGVHVDLIGMASIGNWVEAIVVNALDREPQWTDDSPHTNRYVHISKL